jgi:hypothetical protein
MLCLRLRYYLNNPATLQEDLTDLTGPMPTLVIVAPKPDKHTEIGPPSNSRTSRAGRPSIASPGRVIGNADVEGS